MLIATFTFALMNVFVKAVSYIPAVEIILFRSIISLVLSVVFLQSKSVSMWGVNKPILFARGLTGAIALLIFFSLLQQVPLAAASSLAYLAPIFTTVLGIFLVKEKVKPLQWFFFILSFIGVIVIQGFDGRIDLVHLVMGIATSFFMGLAYNFIRMLKTTEHPLVIILYFPLVMLPIAGIWSAFVWVTPVSIMDWFYLLMVGVLTQVAQYFMTKSYQSEELSKVSIVNYIGIVFSLSFGYFIFDETFHIVTLLGMLMVVGGVVLNVLFKK
jgi:drug/metabolite transporter (DMT)-like permease